MLVVSNLTASVNEKQILKGVNLEVPEGKIVALMGPNGSGKSTLAKIIMGSPGFEIESGDIIFQGESIINLSPDERAKRGLFLAFQYPQELQGVKMRYFLKLIFDSVRGEESDPLEFKKHLDAALQILGLDSSFLSRFVNEGFSGGEKKKSEILQLLLLAPQLAILDETDSGLDVDALKTVAKGVLELKKGNPKTTLLVITHYERILDYLQPDLVYIMQKGFVVRSGGKELVEEIITRGYEQLQVS